MFSWPTHKPVISPIRWLRGMVMHRTTRMPMMVLALATVAVELIAATVPTVMLQSSLGSR